MELGHHPYALCIAGGMGFLVVAACQGIADGYQATLLVRKRLEDSPIDAGKTGILGEYLHGNPPAGGIEHGTHRQADGITAHRIGGEGEENTRVLQIVQITVYLSPEHHVGIVFSGDVTVSLRTADKAAFQHGVVNAHDTGGDALPIVAVRTLVGTAAIEIAADSGVLPGSPLGRIQALTPLEKIKFVHNSKIL